MTVTSLDTDQENLALTLVADFTAPVEEVWRLWADPRLLERWWGPPSYPATVVDHDLTPGGDIAYYMTAPDGEKYRGWWRVTAVQPPSSLEFIDGFADGDGNPAENMPTTNVSVELAEHHGGTRMVMRSTFDTREQMDQLVNMGMVEGLRQSVGQMDALVGE